MTETGYYYSVEFFSQNDITLESNGNKRNAYPYQFISFQKICPNQNSDV